MQNQISENNSMASYDRDLPDLETNLQVEDDSLAPSVKEGSQGKEVPSEEATNIVAERPPTAFEKYLFALLSGMVTNSDLPFVWQALINLVEDIQLQFFAWTPNYLDSTYGAIQFIFNPIFYLIKNIPVISHITAFSVFAVLLASFAYCAAGLARGRLKVVWPLQLLRLLTVFSTTFLFTPFFQVLIQPLRCQPDRYGDSIVPNFDLACGGGAHIGIIVSCVFGLIFLIPFTSVMSTLYYNPNPMSKIGKTSGSFQLIYIWTRMILVIIQFYAEARVATILNTIFIGSLVFIMFMRQPYYSSILNNIRVGALFTGFIVNAISVIGAFTKPEQTNALIYFAILLTIGFGFIPIGSFANYFIVNYFNGRIYDALLDEQSKLEPTDNSVRVAGSQLDLIMSNVSEVLGTKAKRDTISLFWVPFWVEVSARFIHDSYLDTHAVTLAAKIFELGLLQYPKHVQLRFLFMYYINNFMPVLDQQRKHHFDFIKKRNNSNLADKFQLYQMQQILRKKAKSNDMGEEDDEVKFMSIVEYQSLEGTARRYHAQTLKEIREFWQSIRQQKPKLDVAQQLATISELSVKTRGMYKTLMKRFPNSKNTLNLNARFSAIVENDRELAQFLRETAEATTQDQETKGATLEAPEQSIGSSSASSKAARIIKQKRKLLEENLNRPLRKFLASANVISLILIALLIGATAVSTVVIWRIESAFSYFALDGARSNCQNFLYNIRRLSYYGRINDFANWNSTLKSLKENHDRWANVQIQYYETGPSLTEFTRVKVWDGEKYHVVKVNGLQTHMMVSSNVHSALTRSFDFYKNTTELYNAPDIRFIIDNIDPLRAFLTDIRVIEMDEYSGSVLGLSNIMLICYILFAAILALFGLGRTLFSFRTFQKREVKILELLDKVPKNVLMDMITTVEEECELIDLDQENDTKKLINKDKRRFNTVLPIRYMITLILLSAGSLVMMWKLQDHIQQSAHIPLILYKSSLRKALVYRTVRQAIDLFEDDRTTYPNGNALAYTLDNIMELDMLNDEIKKKFADFLPPNESAESSLNKALRSGMCFYGPASVCNSMTYDDSIGFTKNVATSGVDFQFALMRETSLKYVYEGNWGLSNKYYKLLVALKELFYASLDVVVKAFDEDYHKRSLTVVSVLFAVSSISFVLIAVMYYVGYWITCKRYMMNNRQLVAIFYGIPAAERAKMAEVNTFVESGGASI